MKKLLNDPAKAVDESVEGFGLAHPDLVRVHTDPLFVTRATTRPVPLMISSEPRIASGPLT